MEGRGERSELRGPGWGRRTSACEARDEVGSAMPCTHHSYYTTNQVARQHLGKPGSTGLNEYGTLGSRGHHRNAASMTAPRPVPSDSTAALPGDHPLLYPPPSGGGRLPLVAQHTRAPRYQPRSLNARPVLTSALSEAEGPAEGERGRVSSPRYEPPSLDGRGWVRVDRNRPPRSLETWEVRNATPPAP